MIRLSILPKPWIARFLLITRVSAAHLPSFRLALSFRLTWPITPTYLYFMKTNDWLFSISKESSMYKTFAVIFLLAASLSVWAGQPAYWSPSPNTSWQWQLTGSLDQNVDVTMYDIDLFNNSAS